MLAVTTAAEFSLLASLSSVGTPVTAVADDAVLLAVAFENTEMTARTYAVAGDALMAVPGVAPLASADAAYGLRDPSVARSGGFYYLAATKPPRAAYLGTGATSLQLYRSANLIDWTPLPDVPAGVPGATRAWAPELLVDETGTYLYYAVTTDVTEDAAAITSFEIYARIATDATLTTWTAPVRQQGLVGAKVIDAQVTRVDDSRGRFVMFYKDEVTLTISRAWAGSPVGPWTTDRTGAWLGVDAPAEGPQLVRRAAGGWRLYYDRYADAPAGRLSYRDSEDLEVWSAERQLSYAPAALRHPGYLWLAADEWTDLLQRPRAVRVYSAGPTSTSSGQPRAVTLGVAQGDTQLWSATQPTRLTAPEAGWYRLDFTLSWVPNGAGQRSAAFRFSNGGVMQWRDSRAATGGGMGTEHGGSDGHFWLAAGEYVEVVGLQTSGGALGVQAVVTFAKEGS
jgi:hypothetical protein